MKHGGISKMKTEFAFTDENFFKKKFKFSFVNEGILEIKGTPNKDNGSSHEMKIIFVQIDARSIKTKQVLLKSEKISKRKKEIFRRKKGIFVSNNENPINNKKKSIVIVENPKRIKDTPAKYNGSSVESGKKGTLNAFFPPNDGTSVLANGGLLERKLSFSKIGERFTKRKCLMYRF
jgi:hypothetical protein